MLEKIKKSALIRVIRVLSMRIAVLPFIFIVFGRGRAL